MDGTQFLPPGPKGQGENATVPRLAKAMSAFTHGRSAQRAAGRDALALATRGASLGADGSGAPAVGRFRVAALALALASLALLVLAPVAPAAKIVDRIVAGTAAAGTTGGLFNGPKGLALNFSTVADGNGTEGWLYVVDDHNHRIQAFNAAGAFQWTIGRDVIKTSPTGGSTDLGDVFEKCVVAVDCKAGSAGTTSDGPTGEFDNPQGIAINQQTGDLYVRDRDNRRVQQFKADGTFVRMWGHDVIVSGKPNDNGTGFEVCDVTNGNVGADCKIGTSGALGGQLATSSTVSTGIAVVPAGAAKAGNLIVADPANRRVQEFTAAGVFLRLWGWDVVNSGPGNDVTPPTNEFEICVAVDGDVCKVAGAAGSGPGRFPNNSPAHVAVDAGGTVYTLESTIGASVPVMRFDSSAVAPAAFVAPGNIGGLILQAPGGLAIDPVTGDLFVGASSSSAILGAGFLRITNPSGSPTVTRNMLATEAEIGTVLGIGLDPSTGTIYTSQNVAGGAAGSSPNRVLASDDNGAPPATMSIAPPSGLGAHEATFNGTVNPNDAGIGVGYRFQFSRNGVTWTDVTPNQSLGTGTSPIAVDDTVTGLEANTFYRVRLVTKKEFGNPEYPSPELTFLTDAVAPEVQTLQPQARTDVGARLLGRVNPNNLPTAYHFEYGETASYGTKAPVPSGSVSGGTGKLVLAEVEGLDPDTTYHYRLCAENAEGSACGADVSFETRGALVAGAARGYEMITPPFKIVRSVGTPHLRPGNNVNPSVPSLDGETAHWSIHLFPLVDDAQGALEGDMQLIHRTGQGWVGSTRNTRSFLSDPTNQTATEPGFLVKVGFGATSGDFETTTWKLWDGTITQDGLLPTQGKYANRYYTRRDGTGVEGFTPWLDNPEQQVVGQGFSTANYLEGNDYAVLNDDGSAMARFGWYRGLAGPGDPSVDQLAGRAGGTTPYLQRAADPAGMPTAPKEPINECTGTLTGGDATQIPARIGTGAATDTIGSQACEESDGATVTGTGDLVTGSASVTNVTAGSGAFAVGQLIFGQGIPNGTRITAVGAGTLTLSAAAAPAASAFATVTEGSPTILLEFSDPAPFVVGKPIAGAGIPPGTTLLSKSGNTFTLSQNATASGSFVTVTQGAPGPGMALEARAQHVVSLRGATVGSNSDFASGLNSFQTSSNAGTVATALSDDGRRVFFQAPDLFASGVRTADCAAQTGTGTDCVPQLFVRSHDSGGDPVVRWISRSRSVPSGSANGYSGAMIAAQQVGLMGAGVAFQGASRDGSVVYFKTNAPLTPDDPNGTGTPGPKTTGSASASSWDLYRYELPADPDDDPGAGVLTRVSGGPAGSADPSTNVSGGDAPLRFHSDDGSRAYFLTTSPIAGADNTPPTGGATSPGGAVGNTAVRNLYLFDDTKEGAERYRFIALLPYFSSEGNEFLGGMIDACASSGSRLSDQLAPYQEGATALRGNCFRGTADGRAVAFATGGRLTNDDDDQAGDVYHYDADADELIRVSAPPPGASPYICNFDTTFAGSAPGFIPTDPAWVTARCNAELGRGTGVTSVRSGLGLQVPIGSWEVARGWGGMRYYNVARDGDGVVSVYFATNLSLVEEDRNASFDVYQWRQGRRSLISPGDSADNAYFAGNSTDGENVFFQTTQRIDPREIDAADLDVYDARVGGGFPYTPPPTPCDVLALECEVEASPAAVATTSATAGFAGAGNGNSGVAPKPKPRRCAKGKVRRGGRCVAKTKAKAPKISEGAKRQSRANADRRASR